MPARWGRVITGLVLLFIGLPVSVDVLYNAGYRPISIVVPQSIAAWDSIATALLGGRGSPALLASIPLVGIALALVVSGRTGRAVRYYAGFHVTTQLEGFDIYGEDEVFWGTTTKDAPTVRRAVPALRPSTEPFRASYRLTARRAGWPPLPPFQCTADYRFLSEGRALREGQAERLPIEPRS